MIFKLFDELKDSFTKQEEKLVKYIKENVEEVKHMNAYEMAEKSKISQPTIVRFSKKIGFKGFAEMRIALNKEEASSKSILHHEINIEDTFSLATKKVLNLNIAAVGGVLNHYDEKSYRNSVELIHKSRQIMILGIGGSGLVAKDMAYKLLKIGKQIYCEGDIHTQIGNLNSFGKGDLLFMISYSGESKDILKAAKIAKRKGITIISITKYIPNSLANFSDINLKIDANEETFRVSSITSRIAQLSVIDILFINLIKENYETYMKFINESKELVNIFDY